MSIPINKEEWNDLLSQAEAGNSEAQYNVGMAYHDGLVFDAEIIVEQDFIKAFGWFNHSLENGNLQAMVVVADYLSDEIAGKKDLELAIRLYNVAIEKGSGAAANNLGMVYRDSGDFEKAFQYYLLAEKLSGESYSLQVGLCNYYGIGTQEDKSKAFEIFKAISEDKEKCRSGYEIDEANFLLGQMYLQGIGVDMPLEKAREFLELADADGDHRSVQEILHVIGRK